MKKLLFVGINYAPEAVGTGVYTADMCEWLAARGYRVRVITAPPYYPAWRVDPNYRNSFTREWKNGVEIIRCPVWIPKNPKGPSRIAHLASFGLTSLAALAYSIRWKPDLVMSIAPTLASAPGVILYSRITRARSWLHFQDFEIDAAIEMGMIPRGFKAGAVWVERQLLRPFSQLSTISQRMLGTLREKSGHQQNVMLMPNWVDLEAIMPLRGESSYRSELGIPKDAVVALYSGTMAEKQGLELLSRVALLKANSPSIFFVFAGRGPVKEKIARACAGLNNVRILDFQPSHRLSEWLGLADIHLLPQRGNVADLVMPSKLTGMLASGRPVLATATEGTEIHQVLQGRGITTPPGDLEAFASALEALADDPSLRVELGREGRSYAMQHLDKNAILKSLESKLLDADLT